MPTYQAVPWSLLAPQQGQRHWATWSKVKQLLQQRGSFLDLGSRHKTHKSLYFYTTTLGFQSKPSLLLIKGNTEHPIPRESKTSEVFCFFFSYDFNHCCPEILPLHHLGSEGTPASKAGGSDASYSSPCFWHCDHISLLEWKKCAQTLHSHVVTILFMAGNPGQSCRIPEGPSVVLNKPSMTPRKTDCSPRMQKN